MKTTILSLAFVAFAAAPALADMSEARNFYQFDSLTLTAGQPTERQLQEASIDGIEVVINLVPEDEGIYNPEEGKILSSQGIEYIHVPTGWRDPKAQEFQSFLNAMNRVGDRKVLVHCWSNARASAMVTAYRVINDSHNKSAEMDKLELIWSDVAGYNWEADTLWQTHLANNIEAAKR